MPLVRELIERGDKVRVLARGEVAADLFGRPVEVIRGELNDEAVVRDSVQGVDNVFHLAAKLHVNEPSAGLLDEYRSVNVEGTRRLLHAAASAGVGKFVFFSTINVYGPGRQGKVFDENDELQPEGIYAETKAEAERDVLSARNSNGDRFGVVLRLAAVYGSRMKGNYVRLARAVERRRFLFVGAGDNRRTTVHQSDAALAAILAAERAAGGSIYNVTDGSIHTLKDIVAAISTAVGNPTPRLTLPVTPVKLGIAAAEGLARALGLTPPVGKALLEKFLEDIAVDGSKIQNELGFEPRFDLARGWRESLGRRPF